MSDHWEEVGWDREALDNANISPTWYLDGQVVMLDPPGDRRRGYSRRKPVFLVPMHGGIWTMCVSLTGKQKIKKKREQFHTVHFFFLFIGENSQHARSRNGPHSFANGPNGSSRD